MKTKILLTSALALAISVPAMAADPTPTTVTSTSSCTETTLGTATGPVDIEADWQANTINLNWDANNGTVSGGPKQCTYDGTFTLPTSITRTGYNFTGWKVVQAACSLSYDDIKNDVAMGQCSMGLDGSINYCEGGPTPYYTDDEAVTAATYGLTQPGDWGVTLYNYDNDASSTMTGKAVCTTSAPADMEYLEDVALYSYKEFNMEEATTILGAEKAAILQQAVSLMKTNEEAAWNLVYGKLLVTDTAPSSTGGGEAKYCYCGVSSCTSSTGETCTAVSRWLYDGYSADCAHYCAMDCARIPKYHSLSFFTELCGSGN